MTKPEKTDAASSFIAFEERLTKIYGPLLASRDLWKVLGYSSPAAYRQSRIRGQIPVVEFKIDGRRGRFALTRDVAVWLFETSAKANN